MRAEEYSERKVEVDGWQVNLITWRLGDVWHCRADNVSPGATLARMEGKSKEDVEAACNPRPDTGVAAQVDVHRIAPTITQRERANLLKPAPSAPTTSTIGSVARPDIA